MVPRFTQLKLKNMMNKTQRLQLLERLVKEGAISLSEAFDLLQPEVATYSDSGTNRTPVFGSHITENTSIFGNKNTSPTYTVSEVKSSTPFPVYSMDKLEEMYKACFPGEFPGPTKL
jgi:hypothetical protein